MNTLVNLKSKSAKYIAICASGPSLMPDDCKKVIASGISVIAVNSSWKAIPGCSYIFSADLPWWDVNIDQVPDVPERWSSSAKACRKHDVNHFVPPYHGAFNSGQRAILFAEKLNATHIILLGFDCSIRYGVHWHGRHENLTNPDQTQVERWKAQFSRVADYLEGKVDIINCSRQTALTCFKRMPLEDVLTVSIFSKSQKRKDS